MKLIQTIREKFARSFLVQHVHNTNRQQKQISLESARTVALLYYLPDEATYKLADIILGKLVELNLKVRVVSFTDIKIIPHYFLPKITQDIITAKDLNWRYQPQKPFVKEFINTEYDLLIDLSLTEYLPLLYCSALSKAGLKVGRFQDDHQLYFDLMIHTSENESIESFATQAIHYLSRINT